MQMECIYKDTDFDRISADKDQVQIFMKWALYELEAGRGDAHSMRAAWPGTFVTVTLSKQRTQCVSLQLNLKKSFATEFVASYM